MINEAVRMLARRFSSNKKEYSGDAENICEQVVCDCWNGSFFQASSGHFSDFWMRDFGLSVVSLIKLGWVNEVKETLAWALKNFSSSGKVTTTVSSLGIAWDFPVFAPDSLGFLLYALSVAKQKKLVKEYKDFLDKEVLRFKQKVIDKTTGLVQQKVHFSSLKDHYIRNSSCYDNIMLGLVVQAGKKVGLHVPFDFSREKFVKTYWSGMHFKDDLDTHYVAGDANVFAFWSGVIEDKDFLNKAISAMQHAQLDKPFALKYSLIPAPQSRIWQSVFAPNYEGNTIWTHLGGCYLRVLKKAKHESFANTQHLLFSCIEKQKNMLEVFHPNGKPYKSFCYKADSGMLWAANMVSQ